jgi:hypothetical protein
LLTFLGFVFLAIALVGIWNLVYDIFTKDDYSASQALLCVVQIVGWGALFGIGYGLVKAGLE